MLAELYPILGLGHLGLTIWTVTFWIVLVAAIHAASLGPRVRRVARALGATALAAGVAGFLCYELLEGAHGWVFVVVDMLTLLFLVFATGAVLFEVLRAARVSVDHLVGAAAAYAMLGVTFTYAFLILQALVGEPVLLGEGKLCGRLEAVADARLADYLVRSSDPCTLVIRVGPGDAVSVPRRATATPFAFGRTSQVVASVPMRANS